MHQPERWINTDEIAAHLGKEATWVWANAPRLGIPRVKIGRCYRYRVSQVDEWLLTQAHA